MLFVVFCGLLYSGKSWCVEELCVVLVVEGCVVYVVDDVVVLGVEDLVVYGDFVCEKVLCGVLWVFVEWCLSCYDVVILDLFNYIKGFCYEFYCLVWVVCILFCLVYCVWFGGLIVGF